MRIGLFPCYIDSFFPEVGIATLELLEGETRPFAAAIPDCLSEKPWRFGSKTTR